MAITYEWQVNTMDRDLSDGFVTKVIYRVKGLDDGTEKARATGEVNFTKPSSLPSDFKSYDSLSESVCLTWVKDNQCTFYCVFRYIWFHCWCWYLRICK